MKIEHLSTQEFKKKVRKITKKYLNSKYKVFVFGSRVTGKGSDRSDIDVGIEGPKPIPVEVLGNIKEEMDDLPFLYSIDVVDFKTVSSDFYKVAKEKIELISHD